MNQPSPDTAVPRSPGLPDTLDCIGGSTAQQGVPACSGDSSSLLGPPQRSGDLGSLGQYRVLRLIGQGGMGMVFEAVDPVLNRALAIKVMRPDLTTCANRKERFLREARAAAAVQHDHVVAIHHVGEHDSIPYLVMPLLQGKSLEQYLGHARLPVAEVLRIGRQAAEGLAAAHERGLVHRDIKPDNLWIDVQEGKVRILDFGLAHAIGGGAGESNSGVVGTPHYMAPEQARAEKVDSRADLFSLGCVLYRASTGLLPFPGANLFEVFTSLAGPTPRPPHELNPEIPQALSEYVMRLLAKDPDERPASAREVASALAAMEGGSAPVTRPAPTLPNRRKRKSLLVASAAAFALLLLLAGIVIIIRLNGSKGEVTLKWGEQEKPAPARTVPPRGDPERSFPEDPLYSLDECYRGEFSPDGKRIVTAGAPFGTRDPGHTRIVDAVKGTLLFHGREGETEAWTAIFSTDGERVFQCGRAFVSGEAPGFLHVWDWTGETLRFVRPLGKPSGWVGLLAVSNDGKFLASGSGPTITLWNARSLTELYRLEHGRDVRAITFSPDSKSLATVSADGCARVYRSLESKAERTAICKSHAGEAMDVVWSPDGRFLYSAGTDSRIYKWDPASGQQLAAISASAPLCCLACSPNGKYLVGGDYHDNSNHGHLRAWELSSGKEVCSTPVHKGTVQTVRFSSDGARLLSTGSAERKGRVWKTPDWLLR